MAVDTATALAGLDTVRGLTAAGYQPAATYPDGDPGAALRELARLIKVRPGPAGGMCGRGRLGHPHQPGHPSTAAT